MKILSIDISKNNKFIINKKVISFLNKIDKNHVLINSNLSILKIIFRLKLRNINLFFKSLINIFFLNKKILKIIKSKNGYYYTLRNCILDQIERETGDLSTQKNSDKFIKKYASNFKIKAFKLLLFLNFIELIIKVKRIECLFFPQLDGFPYTGLTALCLKKDLFIGSYSNNGNIAITIRKNLSNERIPLPYDKNILANLSEIKINKAIDKIKLDYILRKDPICLSGKILKQNQQKDINFFKSAYKNNKKNILVLLHVLTDQSRIRLENSWYENYFDWILETIKYCKLNKNVNWFFKGHPHEDYYPINEHYQNLIIGKIQKNNFVYIDSKQQFLHGEVAKLASAIVTCTGTCKIEYQAMFEIPVISCLGRYSIYEIESQPNTARTSKEYKNLIKNAHNLILTNNDIRASKEALLFFKRISGASINDSFEVKKFIDKENEQVIRNF